ncbi:MAG: SUMF1/EgtB/PvdO family nonheme iron enzyme, partial [Thermoanaerobaculia bacterium]|nr:SUMF1/EgtB/PvdO family nonheme iron enzyme [Thermoanaerobaculia bacterium]
EPSGNRRASPTSIAARLAARGGVGLGVLLVVAVATHGLSDQGGDFLVAADSLRTRVVKTGVAIDELFDEVARAGAQRRLVLLDACRERLSADTRGAGALSAMGQRFVDAIAKASGQVVLVGATLGGFAYDDAERQNGVFTAAVVDGLRGAASADGRGFITVRTLADYVHERVVEWVKAHRPEHARRSSGIARRIEGDAEALPLAVNAVVKQAAESYRRRREAALVLLRENIGEVITGVLYEQIKGRLPLEDVGPEVAALLDEIEALDGSVRSQRNLAYFIREAGHKKPRRGYWLWGTAAALVFVLLGAWVIAGWVPETGPATTATPLLPPAETAQPAAGDPLPGPFGMRFRYVPAGTYQIGSPESEPGRFDNEPLHQVELTRGFWIGETEVTQAQWRALMGSNPAKHSECGDDCPVDSVSWFEVVGFANRLSSREGLESCYEISGEGVKLKTLDCDGYRLPTEAEWEVAAREGQRDSTDLDKIAWYRDNSSGPHPVKGKEPNPWQLYDMLGNVWEWTWDWYGPYPAKSTPDPLGPEVGSERVLRGGSWNVTARSVRAAARHWFAPGDSLGNVGFRLARGQVRQE